MKEYLQAVALYMQNNIDMRYGQALFNCLLDRDRTLAEEIRGTRLDPFYWGKENPTTREFLAWVAEKL